MADRVKVESGYIQQYTHYVVDETDAGDHITYMEVDYYKGDTFIGGGVTTFTSTGNPLVYENTIYQNSGLELKVPTIYNESSQFIGSGLEMKVSGQYSGSTQYVGAGMEMGKVIYYFAEGEGALNGPYLTNNIGINKYSDYLLEINPVDNAQLKGVHGKGAGDKLTVDELIGLSVSHPDAITCNYDDDIIDNFKTVVSSIGQT